jgi:hypothetical protein
VKAAVPAACCGRPALPQLAVLVAAVAHCTAAQRSQTRVLSCVLQVERAKKALAAPGGKTLAAGQQSDHLLMAAVYGLWQKARQEGPSAGHKAARQHCLSVQTLEQLAEMRTQFAAMLADIR